MKRNIIIVLVSVLILTCLFAFARTTTTDLGLVKPTWEEEDPEYDILVDLNSNTDIIEAFANAPLLYDAEERVEDRAGAMWTGNTETFVTVTYQDADNTIDIVVPVLDEDAMTSNSTTYLCTQQSIKAYVDNFTGSTNIVTVGTIATGVWQGTAIADAYISNTLTVTGYMQDGDINTFSKLQAWVTDKTLVNEEDIFTIDANWVNTANPWADNEVANNITIDLATLASTLTVADNEDTNENNALVFLPGGDLDGGNLALECDGNLYYNPSTGALTADMHRVYLTDESTALNAAWYQITSSVVTGDLTGLRTVMSSDAVSGGGAASGVNVRGVYGQAVAEASAHAGLLQGGLFVADVSAGSVTAYNVHVLCAHYSAGASATIGGDLYVGYLRSQTREDNARSVTGSDSILAIENEAVQGDGGTVDAGIRIFDTNISGSVKGFTYGIDMTDAKIDTADIRLQNGEIIENKTDGKITFTGELTGDGGGLTNLPGGYTDLTEFVDQTTWCVFYSDGSGDVIELALGADGTYLESNGAAAAPTFTVPAGAGDVVKVGTPVDSQIGVWTGDGTIEGAATLTFDGTVLVVDGDITIGANYIGRDSDNIIDFATDDHIIFKTSGATGMEVDSTGELDMNTNSVGFTLQTATGDGTTTIDWKLGNKFRFTFGSQNDTLTFTAPTNPGNFMLWVIQDGTGSRTMTWPSIRWAGGTAPTLSTAGGSVDIIALVWDGTNWDGVASLAFATP